MAERGFVWIGIVLLLGVVYLEWSSRNQYEESYKSLEAALAARDQTGQLIGLTLGQVDRHIKGFAFRTDKVFDVTFTPLRGEPVVTKKRKLKFQWPSLFKHYEFELWFGKDDQIVQIEAVIPGNE